MRFLTFVGTRRAELARLKRLLSPSVLVTPVTSCKPWRRSGPSTNWLPRRRNLFTGVGGQGPERQPQPSSVLYAILAGGGIIWLLYPSEAFDELSRIQRKVERNKTSLDHLANGPVDDKESQQQQQQQQTGAWFDFSRRFESVSGLLDLEWSKMTDTVIDFILPEWSKMVPVYLRKLQNELSMAPGSLADEIWRDAHDPTINPEIRYSASVRVSEELCAEETEFLARRRKIVTVAFAKYLGINERDVHPDDVPVIAMCGSGGGLRALVAASGSLMATQDDGLLDCFTYTSGVSGSCWLQALYHSSVSGQDLHQLVNHLKARLGVHIAYPPVAFQSVVSAPTNKYLLSGIVEKLKGDPNANLGLVDMYGILLASRLLVPKGELGVNERDFKLSNQRDTIKYGAHPMPIYTAVRHEIPDVDPDLDKAVRSVSEAAKEEAKREAWFQWFEITPYEFFCEEFSAGVPTWAIGRKFKAGKDVPPEHGFHLPELRMPLLMGVFGSAFCATLSHYYREVRPIVRNIAGLSAVDDMISGRNEDLSKVHPIDPARIPNFVFGMEGQLAKTTPDSVCKHEYLQLMDAGMSNNLPIYPLLRPGRNVDVLIAFDASADIKTDNWLSVVDGYARQRGVKGWPVGIGWPKPTDSPTKARDELEEASAKSAVEAQDKLAQAKTTNRHGPHDGSAGANRAEDLGYCTVWVGTTEERKADHPPPAPSKAIDDSTTWRLMAPDAGLAVIYLPLLANPKVPGVIPGTGGGPVSDYLSTWNFVYTPSQVDDVVALAKANFVESKDHIRSTVRAVYERKKKARETAESQARETRFRRRVRKGLTHGYGEGDHFS